MLGRHEQELGRGRRAQRELVGRHQRELVERQGPRDPGGDGERDALHTAAAQVVEQPGERADVARTGEGEGPGHGDVVAGADGDEQRVEVEDVAAHRAQPARRDVYRQQVVGAKVRSEVARDLGQVEPSRRRSAEGRRDRPLPLHEVDGTVHELDDGLGAEVGAQGRERLETGDPAAGDHDARHAPTVGTSARWASVLSPGPCGPGDVTSPGATQARWKIRDAGSASRGSSRSSSQPERIRPPSGRRHHSGS